MVGGFVLMWRPSRPVWAAGTDTATAPGHPGSMTPTSVRQITVCTDRATHIHRRRQKARGLLYEVTVCRRHRPAVEGWGKTLRPLDVPRPCGAVDDYRDPHEIVVSHFDWLMAGTAPRTVPPSTRDEWALALRAAHADAASLHTDGPVVTAVDRAARAAETSTDPAPVMLALAEAETYAAAARRC